MRERWKKLYPGGVSEAKSPAERARQLEDIDGAYFGTVGKSAQELSAGRAALAQRLLAQDTAAFREMVAEGVGLLKAWAAPGRHKAKSLADAANKPRRTPQQAARRESSTTILQGFASRK
jgi:hypothetical protein